MVIFSFIKDDNQYAQPNELLVGAPSLIGGEAITFSEGGKSINAKILLNIVGSDRALAREGIYTLEYDGIGQSFSTLDNGGKPVSNVVLAERLQEALSRIPDIGLGNVIVSGTRANGFVLEFTGVLSGSAISLAQIKGGSGLWLVQPVDLQDVPDWGLSETVSDATTGLNAIQQLRIQRAGSGGSSDQFTLTVDGETTDQISYLPNGSQINEQQTITIEAAEATSGQFWFEINDQKTNKIRFGGNLSFQTSQNTRCVGCSVRTGQRNGTLQHGI